MSLKNYFNSFRIKNKHFVTGLVGTLRNKLLREKDLRLFAQNVVKTANVVISSCCYAARSCYEVRAARAARATRLFFSPIRPIKFLICGVVVAVPIVDAKVPCCFTDDEMKCIQVIDARAQLAVYAGVIVSFIKYADL